MWQKNPQFVQKKSQYCSENKVDVIKKLVTNGSYLNDHNQGYQINQIIQVAKPLQQFIQRKILTLNNKTRTVIENERVMN